MKGSVGFVQYFEPRPSARSARREVELVLPDVHATLVADTAVFSGDRIDPGTKLLLQEAPPPPPEGALLDLGCGYGPIAIVMAHRAPHATVWAVDVNERARELSRENAERLGLGNVRVAAPADVPAEVRFRAIWSNPPIRIGKRALHDLLEAWLARLEAGAAAHLVVHKHLGSDSLHRWLAEQGWPTTRRASRAGYRLLEVRARSAA